MAQSSSEESKGSQSGQSSSSVQRQPQTGAVSRRSSPFFLSPMDLFAANPFSLMRRMSEEMDRMFTGALTGETSERAGSTSSWMPPIEIRHSGDNLIVCAELPGLKKEDVKVEIEDGGLAIHGERKFESSETTGGVHRTERRYGQFYRMVPLPEGANPEAANAKFENGMLEITVPVAKQTERRNIPIQTGGEATTIEAGSSSASTKGKGASAAGA